MVGHGSSDNAASYGVYAFGLLPRWTALRDSISLTVYYGAELDMSGCTALALSQSGRTPDVVEYARQANASRRVHGRDHERPVVGARPRGRRRARAPGGPRARGRGDEDLLEPGRRARSPRAHAARQGERSSTRLRAVAETMPAFIRSLESRIGSVAIPFAYAGRMFVVGRGAEFATAREIALKLLETCRIAAEPLTATDLAHGPVAALDSLFPVWAIASDDPTLPAVVEAVERAREAGATIVASGSAASVDPHAPSTCSRARDDVAAPRAAPLDRPGPALSPGRSPRARGLDPDAPRGLSKVTLAR